MELDGGLAGEERAAPVEAQCNSLSVTVGTPRTDFGASRYWVPGRIGPFYFRLRSQNASK